MLTRRSDLQSLGPQRICLIKPSSLGDVVHALPVLRAIRKLWPAACISWVVNRGLVGLLEGHPDLDEIIPFDRSRIRFSPRGVARFGQFLNQLRRKRFDLTIDLQGLMRSGLMTMATGSPVRIGLAGAREGAQLFYTHRIEPPAHSLHAIDKMMAVVAALGGSSDVDFTVAMSDADRRWATDQLRHRSGPTLVMNVGARWLTKRWPPSRFAEVARSLVHTNGVNLVAVGAPEDRPLVDELVAAIAPIPVLDICGQTTLPQLAALFQAADCVLSNDTGPLHLAAATGTRVVGVYTCTSPAKTGPYGAKALSVTSRIWCAASCVKTCDRLDCMRELVASRVESAVRRQLELAAADRFASVA